MRGADQQTIKEIGVSGLILMENAGRRTARRITEFHGRATTLDALIVCGPGNNGGDGFVITRHLHARGAATKTVLIGSDRDVKGDAETNLKILIKMGLDVDMGVTDKPKWSTTSTFDPPSCRQHGA